MEYYVYILKSDLNGSYYIGSTQDIEKRLDLHRNGMVTSTKRYLPWRLVYKAEYPNLSDARKRELQIKSWKKREAIENLINNAA
ncbi:MAG: Excinuclease abc c subunit domain protein [Parcubacteria group bacterium GW2011_GWA2_44_13]|nr:MAG: Excinuclease abc c subunit domain protein [Parcubacteria group bacterium GW2011_GWA2_44_13]